MKKYISLILIAFLMVSQSAALFAVGDTSNSVSASSSGTTLSGGIEILSADTTPKLSDMKYYEGTFTLGGQTYGNSFYEGSMDFSKADLSKVKIMSYDEYMQKSGANQSFQVLAAPTNGLIGSWDLNGNGLDTSGNGVSGTPSNVGWEKSAGVNQVGVFNGINAGITLGNSANFNDMQTVTYSADIYISSIPSMGIMPFSKNWRWFRINSDYSIEGDISLSGGHAKSISSTKLKAGEWYNLTYTYNNIDKKIKIYINGIEVSYQVQTAGIGTLDSDVSKNVLIGKYNGDSYIFNGKIANFKIYNREITLDEIKSLYINLQEKILGMKLTLQTGLIGSWDLNGDALDRSGNNIHGNASNVAWEKSAGANQVGVFNGASSQIVNTLASQYSKTNGSTMSVSAWVKWDTSAGYQDVMTMRSSSGHNWILYRHNDNGAISFHGGTNQYKGSYVLPANQWVFVTSTVDSSGNLKVYADTKEVYSGAGYTFGTAQSQLTIGSAAGMGEWFKGRLGLLKIYNKVLSADEINALYQEGQEKILGIIPTPTNKVTTFTFAGLTITVTESAAMYKTEVNIGGFKIYFGIEKV